MKFGRAFLAGVLGGVLMSLLLWSAQDGFAMPASLSLMLGTMIGLEPFAIGTAVAGQAMHLAIAGAIGVTYAWIFERRRSHFEGIFSGALFGLAHAGIAGLVLLAVPAVHPMIPESLAPVGPFMSRLGVEGVAAFILLHLIYGATVGSIYAPAILRRHTVTTA